MKIPRMAVTLRPIWRLTAVLALVVSFYLFTSSPALALDLNPSDYFQLTYDSPSFDKSAVVTGETFHVAIHGTAVCIKDLPISISELSITSKIIARPTAGGSDLTLNPQYIINIKPQPNKAGGYFTISQNISLQVPNGSTYGDYTVIGQLTKAQVKILVWIDVTGSFPKEQGMGKVKYTAEPAAALPSSVSNPQTASATPLSPVSNPLPTSVSSLPPATSPVERPAVPWWIVLAVAAAVSVVIISAVVFGIVWSRRHR